MLSETKSYQAGKKLIIYLTIASLLNLVGCYYQQQMTPEEYNFTDKEDIKVTTTDTVYTLKSDEYYYSNDTLFASVTKPLDEKTNFRYTIGIPVENIEMVEIEKTDVVSTSLTVLGVLVGVFAIILAVAFSNGLY